MHQAALEAAHMPLGEMRHLDIYRASREDANALAQCFGRYRDWRPFGGPTDPQIADEIRLASYHRGEFLVSGHPPHSFIYYRWLRSLWLRGDICLVEILWVDEKHRGAGLGRALLRAAEARAQQFGAKRMEFHANAENAPAVALYQSEGFSAHNEAYDGDDLYFRKSL